MFSRIAISVSLGLMALVGLVAAESHQVTFTNNCGRGQPQWLYQGSGVITGGRTINGQLNGGIAWLGEQGNCGSSGVNCGAVEFTLQNTGYSQADITLEVGPNGAYGNHQYTYPLGFNFINGCSSGQYCGSANCADASRVPNDIGSHLTTCPANNAGIHITFC